MQRLLVGLHDDESAIINLESAFAKATGDKSAIYFCSAGLVSGLNSMAAGGAGRAASTASR